MAYFLIEGGVKGEGGKRSFASKVKQKIMPTSTRKSERLQKPATRIEEAY
jgi:intein-encoded DNA endonuclease-like protein